MNNHGAVTEHSLPEQGTGNRERNREDSVCVSSLEDKNQEIYPAHALIDSLIKARPVYGTRQEVEKKLRIAERDPEWDIDRALHCLATRAAYEISKKQTGRMKLETMLENGSWKVDWSNRIREETGGGDL